MFISGCWCCGGCPCGPETIQWGAGSNVIITVVISGTSFDVCKNSGSTLTFNDSGLSPGHPYYCTYYSDYDIEGTIVRVFYLVDGPECVYQVNGWTGATTVTATTLECT